MVRNALVVRTCISAKLFTVSVLVAGTSAAAGGPAVAQPAPAGPTGMVIARGQVTFADGRAAPGVPVSLLAWPKGTARTRVGTVQAMPLLASTVSGRSGQFSLAVSTAGPLLRAARNGIVSLQVDTAGADGSVPVNFARSVQDRGGRLLVSPALRPGAAAAPARADLRLATDSISPGLAAQAPAACSVHTLKNYGPRWVTVAEAFANVNGVKLDFTYSRDQSSSLGIGFSFSGKVGTFKADGTLNKSNTRGQRYPTLAGPWFAAYQTEFTYAKVSKICGGGRLSPRTTKLKYFVKATGYAGGGRVVHLKKPPRATHCVFQEKGTAPFFSDSTAVTISAGVTIPALKLTLTAQTGYSDSAALTFTFTKNRRLCGTNGDPGGTPKTLVARQ